MLNIKHFLIGDQETALHNQRTHAKEFKHQLMSTLFGREWDTYQVNLYIHPFFHILVIRQKTFVAWLMLPYNKCRCCHSSCDTWTLIGQHRSSCNTGLWLVNTDHMTPILASDWSTQITWPQYWPLIGQWCWAWWWLQQRPTLFLSMFSSINQLFRNKWWHGQSVCDLEIRASGLWLVNTGSDPPWLRHPGTNSDWILATHLFWTGGSSSNDHQSVKISDKLYIFSTLWRFSFSSETIVFILTFLPCDLHVYLFIQQFKSN